MKLLDHTTDRVTLEFTRQELYLAHALIQEGRISHQCDSPEGQALEDRFRSIVIRLEETAGSGVGYSATH